MKRLAILAYILTCLFLLISYLDKTDKDLKPETAQVKYDRCMASYAGSDREGECPKLLNDKDQ